MMIRDALKHGCYELQKARDAWRVAVGPDGMDADLVLHYIEVYLDSSQMYIKKHTFGALVLKQVT